MRAVAAVDWRERRSYPSLKAGIFLLAVFMLAVVFPPRDGVRRQLTYRVGVVGELPASLEEILELQLPAHVHLRFVAQPDRASAERAVRARALAAAVADGEILARSRVSSTPVEALRRALPRAEAARRLEAEGVERSEAQRVAAAEPAPVRLLQPISTTRRANVVLAQWGAGATGFIVFLLFQFLVNGVQEERGRRQADVLVLALRPLEIVAGKVLGVIALGLTVIGLAAVPAVAVGVGFRGLDVVGHLGATAVALPWWFALHCAFYGCVAIATGATAPSQDEAGLKGLASATFMGMGSVAAALVAASPEGPVAVGLSFFPPVAAPVMLVRAAAGEVAAWEVAVSVALIAASTVVAARIAARVYLGGVVRAGEKLSIFSAFRAGGQGRPSGSRRRALSTTPPAGPAPRQPEGVPAGASPP